MRIFALLLVATACRRSPSSVAAPATVTFERPSPRSAFGMAYDARRGRIVLFGGSDTAYKPLGDTWEWSNNRWTRVDAPAPARANFAMAYDARRGRVVVFGGSTAAGRTHDTWEFDGKAWTQVDTAGPPARNLVSMAYDESRGRMVMFGGAGARGSLGDTWEWDGTAWREMPASSPAPAPRGSHTLVYDGSRRHVVLVGGYTSDAASDGWEWDGMTWSRVSDSPATFHHAAAYDPTTKRVLVFGGFSGDQRSADTWARSGDAWSKQPGDGPMARAEHRGAYVPGLGFLIFGGIGGQGMSLEERSRSKRNDLWVFDGTRWREIDAGRAP